MKKIFNLYTIVILILVNAVMICGTLYGKYYSEFSDSFTFTVHKWKEREITIGDENSESYKLHVQIDDAGNLTFIEHIEEGVQWCKIVGIDANVFEGRTDIKSVELPDTLRTIGDNAFKGTSLTSVTIPESVTDIGTSAFENVTTLTTLELEGNSVYIGAKAFLNCTSLSSMTTAEVVTSDFSALLKLDTFSGNSSTNANFAGKGSNPWFRTDYPCEIVDGILYQDASGYNSGLGYMLIKYPVAREAEDYKISDKVISIDRKAFYGSDITAIDLNKVVLIGESAFYSCEGLTSLYIPNSVQKIKGSAFQNCRNLKSLDFEEEVTLIELGGFAFSVTQIEDTITLPTIKHKDNNVTGVLMEGLFNNSGTAKIIVPNGIVQIKAKAFGQCYAASIVLPDSVHTIHEKAFIGRVHSNNVGDTIIYYNGTLDVPDNIWTGTPGSDNAYRANSTQHITVVNTAGLNDISVDITGRKNNPSGYTVTLTGENLPAAITVTDNLGNSETYAVTNGTFNIPGGTSGGFAYDKTKLTLTESSTFDLLENEEFSTIDFNFDGIDDTNLSWLPISEHEDMKPYPNEDYQISFEANEGYKLSDIIEVIIDGTVYNVATNGDNAEGEPTFANGILTIPAELLTEETKSLVITVSAVEIVEQKDEEKTDEEKADEEQTKDPSEEQNPTEETDDKKDDTAEDTTPKDEETETGKSDDTSNDNTTSGGEADKETDTDKPTEEIKQTFDIDITEIKNADIKGKDGKSLSAENLLDEDGNAILVITADKDHTIPQSFNITICDTEYTIDTTKAEQEDGIVWDSETGTLTIPKDLVSGENVEIGVKLQAIIKEDDDEEADKKPEEDKNPDGDDSTEDTDDTTSGGTEGEKPKDETTEGGTGTDDTEQGESGNVGGNTDTENDETTENSGAENGGTENGEQKPSDDTAETPGEDTETDTPVVPPVTDGEQTGGTDDEANGDDSTEEGGEANDGGDNVPPATEETPAQPPVTEDNDGDENPVVPNDKVETPGEDTSSGSTETGGNDDSSSGGTESGNDTPQGDTSASGNNNSTGESTDTSGSTTGNSTPAAPPASESTNNSVATPTAPSTSTGTSTQGGESNSQGSGTTGGTSGGDGNSSSNTSTTSTTTNTTAKKKTETTGSTGGDDSGDSN